MSILHRMGDRAVYCARLESVCAARHQGFESPPIRFFLVLLLVLVIVCDPAAAAENDLTTAERQYQQEKFDAALASLDGFEKSSAPTATSLDLRGCIYMEQQKFDEAKKAFEAAHNADPAIFAPRLHLGDLLLRQKKVPEAREVYQVLLKETNILMSSERLRFAILLTYLGEHDETNAQKALRIIPFPTQTPAYYFAQAAWAFAHDKKSDGDDWLNKSAKVFERDATLWFARHLYDFGWSKKKPPLSPSHN
jgi:tetratricopeptide (TPR) repeat protein